MTKGYSIFEEAKNLLQCVREQTDSIGVAFSGGKDSHVVIDLCASMFKRIEAYYMYRVPNLQMIQSLCERIKRQYEIDVQHYPHFDLVRCFKNAVFQPHWEAVKTIPSVKMKDIEDHFRKERGVDWIVYGWRASDSRSRAIILSRTKGIDFKGRRVFPLRRWKRRDVLTYLRHMKIPIPPALGREEQGGVDMHREVIKYLKEFWPEDLKKFLEVFPYAEAQLTNV
jgi:3'-phosphoadenosine 5'-phosphosulfate sulfotransferase (PAPS reductase)/FAD synthetase